NKAGVKKELSVDYAYYLEKNGRELPLGYWIQRLDSPQNFINALGVVAEKNISQVTVKLQALFQELKTKPADSVDAGKAAGVAAVLFRKSREVIYRDYLTEKAKVQLASNSFESSLPKILDGLAVTNDKV